MKYRLVGFERETSLFAEEHKIPEQLTMYVQGIARIPPDDPNAIGDTELSGSAARDIAGLIGAKIDLKRCDYMLEPYEDDSDPALKALADQVANRKAG